MLQEILLKKKVRDVKTAITGEDGIKIFNNEKFDLVFLDVMLPGLDGKAILPKLREINKKIPIYYITGQVDISSEDINKQGVQGIIRKPFHIKEITNIIDQVIIQQKQNPS